MPFRDFTTMEERIGLLRAWDSGGFSVALLCARYGVSRETFYVWKRRRDSGDRHWFMDKSHAPRSCPHATDAEAARQIVAVRERFVHFGPKKIKAWLERHDPRTDWPAASTIGDIVKRAGLVTAKTRARRAIAQGDLAAPAHEPNAEWAIDFKGWFRTANNARCDPLTLTDAASRFLLAVTITPLHTAGVRAVLGRVFREHGLPDALRSDNGAPFGSPGPAGLSRLSVWLVKLGVRPRFIPPASPQDNGDHERMHRTLKAHTQAPPARTLAEQQRRFDAFRRHYNEERPHEALGQRPPVALWRASPRAMPARPDEPWYDADHQIRRVRCDGTIKWKGAPVFVGQALAGEWIGLAEDEGGAWRARFFDIELGLVDCQGRFVRFAPPRTRRRKPPEPALTKAP